MTTRRSILAAGIGVCIVAIGFQLFLTGPTNTAEAIIGDREEGTISVAGVLTSPQWDIVVNLPANHLLLLDIDAAIYGSPLDSVLQVLDKNQQVIAENDDDSFSADSALGVIIPTAGSYTIRIKDAQDTSGPDFFFLLNGSLRPVVLSPSSAPSPAHTEGKGAPTLRFPPKGK